VPGLTLAEMSRETYCGCRRSREHLSDGVAFARARAHLRRRRDVSQALRLLLEHDERIEIVAIASNGEEAVKLALLHRPDIVTMDIQMPVTDGV
jgi:CheY-like chemotaxis protein